MNETEMNLDSMEAMLTKAGDIEAAFSDNEAVFVTESETDALVLLQAGANAVGVGLDGGHDKIKDYEGPLPERVYILSDGTSFGEDASKRIKKAFKGHNREATILHLPNQYNSLKEFAEGDEGLLKCLLVGNAWEVYEYEQTTSAGSYLEKFWDDVQAKTPAIQTGFSKLDNELGGGIYEGLYIVGAVSSLGKTTFCLQLADQLAFIGHDVIIFSLEMARYELMAKSLSRLTLQLSGGLDNPSKTKNAKTARALTDPARVAQFDFVERDLIDAATKEYSGFASHLWINEGMGTIGTAQIRDFIKKHIEIKGNVPIVFIDYLQILASPDPRMTDKQATDRNVFELKRISREFKCPIIAVSSFNRDNYTAALNMAAFKESGAIEYSSDVLIGFQPKGMTDIGGDKGKAENAKTLDACKTAPERLIELKILKNRHGKTNGTIDYRYIPMFNYFEEEEQTQSNVKKF